MVAQVDQPHCVLCLERAADALQVARAAEQAMEEDYRRAAAGPGQGERERPAHAALPFRCCFGSA